MTLRLNGITGLLPWEDAWDICSMLVALGRAVKPSEWVDELVAERQAMAWEMFGPA